MNKTIATIIIIALIAIGGYFLFKGTAKAPSKETINQQVNASTEPNTTQVQGKNEVIYTDSGYSPSKLIIKVGETVTWKNESSGGVWVASGMHPTHVIYSGTSLDEHCPDIQNTSFDECKSSQPGDSWSFKFDKKGIWRYHNHVQAADFGSVVVE